MNKKAQMDIEPIPALLGIIGGVAAWVMAGRMEAGIFLKIIVAVLTTGACYFIGWKGANS